MIRLPVCVLYTRDPDVVRRVRGSLVSVAQVFDAASPDAAEALLAQYDPAVILADVRDGRGGAEVLDLLKRWPNGVCVALGDRRSDPLRAALRAGAFAAEELDPDPWRMQTLVERAFENLRLRRELAIQQEAAARPYTPLAQMGPATGGAKPLWHLAMAMRNIANVQSLFERTVEGLSAAMLVSRVGIFARRAGVYALCAGSGCLDRTHGAAYDVHDPLVHWMVRHSHLISGPMLDHVAPEDRAILHRALEVMGAEAIAPFFARGCLYGWIFIGRRATGAPFGYGDLEEFSVLAGHIATMVENAYLYEEAARQRTLAETLLHALPTGVVAASEDGAIRWFNAAAGHILELEAQAVVGHPIEAAGSRLADLIRRALSGQPTDKPETWNDPKTGRSLAVETRRLAHGEVCLGAVALVDDRTEKERMARREEELDRSAFWNDLASAMSHEIRNPLVAIKTFAQLLPDRYGDAEFRQEFSGLVSAEVDRLNGIVDLINGFAHPKDLRMGPVDVARVIRDAVAAAKDRVPDATAAVEMRTSDPLPVLRGDVAILADSLSHVITNALEATAGWRDALVVVAAEAIQGPRGPLLSIMVRDNGPGIAPAVRDRIFSPFGTTKARGLGLGLPIVRRAVLDHGGQIRVDSCERGTRVTIFLPVAEPVGIPGTDTPEPTPLPEP